ncbi:MAG: ATP-grasp domain-containing protein [Bdellovibrionia bacterium]
MKTMNKSLEYILAGAILCGVVFPPANVVAQSVETAAPEKKRILVLQPTHWDQMELDKLVEREAYELVYEAETSRGNLWSGVYSLINPFRWADWMKGKMTAKKIDAVIGMDDHPAATLAALLAERMGLKGTPPESILTLGNKYESRKIQAKVVPEAAPKFALVDPKNFDPKNPPLPYPFFLKPVHASTSYNARMIRNEEAFTEALKGSWLKNSLFRMYNRHFDFLTNHLMSEPVTSNHYIAEEPLKGVQITVDGFMHDGKAKILGVVDSVMYPGTTSFESFQYPSNLPEDVQRRMGEIAQRFVEGSTLNNTVFNIEMFYDKELNRISIIEINPRMSMQFSDMHEKVDGVGLYQIQAELATGKRPSFTGRNGQYKVAASFVAREFKGDTVVKSVPDAVAAERALAEHPDARVHFFASKGLERLDNLVFEDPESKLVSYVNIGGESRSSLRRAYERLVEKMGVEIRRPSPKGGAVCAGLLGL